MLAEHVSTATTQCQELVILCKYCWEWKIAVTKTRHDKNYTAVGTVIKETSICWKDQFNSWFHWSFINLINKALKEKAKIQKIQMDNGQMDNNQNFAKKSSFTTKFYNKFDEQNDSQRWKWLTDMKMTHRDENDSQRWKWLTEMKITHRDENASQRWKWLTEMKSETAWSLQD